jgi:monofunctional biosynthetic peptidoglycan transglycosylase
VTKRVALAAAASLLLLGFCGLAWVWSGLPPRAEVRALRDESPGRTRLMLEREEQARARGRRARTAQAWVPLSAVSRHLIHAVVASEDQSFFGHEGVDWRAIQESIEKNVEKRRFARGGSTITQQLAKNLYFGTRKTPLRKLRELAVTRWLEADLTKARILALYLNVIEWGDGIYGCEAAARHWYGKPASALNEHEAAGLAAMIPNPRRINPAVSQARHERATRRVVWLMAQAGYLGRDAAPLGAEPPPEPLPEDDEAELPPVAPADAAPTPTQAPETPPEPALPPPTQDPAASPSPSPSSTPSPTPGEPPPATPTPPEPPPSSAG